jgi:hypothetical protein
LNVGYFGADLTGIVSNWNAEYIEKIDHTQNQHKQYPVLWNYEIAIDEKNPNINKVSKHCIVGELKSEAKESYFTKRYYYHFNQ